MSATYDLGDSVKLTFTVRKDGSLIDATVSLLLTKPDGATVAVPSPGHPSLGTYTHEFAPDQAGLWLFKWTATGAATTAEDGQLIVEANLAPTLYASVEELREHLGDTDGTLDVGRLELAVRAGSRAVDGWCRRRFWQDATPVARTYRPTCHHRVATDDIASTTGLLVKTDETGDGAFETSWAASDFELLPRNAAADGGAYAWWEIQAIGARAFPAWPAWPTVGPWDYGLPQPPPLQVTARWGWSQVPDPVREATLLKAASVYRRKDAPFGVAGFDQFGPVRITRADPDVLALLGPFRRLVVA